METSILLSSFSSGGKVEKYAVGTYNTNDYPDLKKIAELKASAEGVTVQLMPKIDSDDPKYWELYPDLKGTIYERKCPDLRIITIRGNNRYVEYESYARPFKPRSLSRMINRGSKQADSIVVDIRDTNITKEYVQRQVRRNLNDPDFHRPINRVWTYDGNILRRVW